MRRVQIGTIATAHGVRGLVKIKCEAEDLSLFDGPVFTAETGDETLTLTLKNPLGKYVLAAVDGIEDRTAAEKLRGTKLWTGRDSLPETEEDEFYFEDLVGLAAFTPDGTPAGTVVAVENFGAGDLLEIRPMSGPAYYLPFTKDNVPDISLSERRIVVIGETA